MSKQRFGTMPYGAKDGESKYLHLLVNSPRDRSPAFCVRLGLRRPIKELKRLKTTVTAVFEVQATVDNERVSK
jgi:hypothetical protein